MKYFLLLIFLCSRQFAFSQEAHAGFDSDTAKFLGQLTMLLQQTQREDCRELAANFPKAWNKLNYTDRQSIINIANQFSNLGLSTYPYFFDFISAAYGFPTSKLSDAQFTQWIDVTNKLITSLAKKDDRPLQDFLEVSGELSNENVLLRLPLAVWKSDNSNFNFNWENDAPIVYFPAFTLSAQQKSDSFSILQTSGKYNILQSTFNGKSGKDSWSRLGLDESKVFCRFGHYTIDLKKTGFSVDSAQLTYLPDFNVTILGKFTDKLSTGAPSQASSFPGFTSYSMNYTLTTIGPDIRYTGGVAMIGAQLNGFGTEQQRAVVRIRNHGKDAIVARSLDFDFGNFDKINSDDAQTAIYIKQDSIWHPGVIFKYDVQQKQLTLIRGTNGNGLAPFIDYYHKYNIIADILFWDLNVPEIKLAMFPGESQVAAIFQSFNYFDKGTFDKYEDVSDFNLIRNINAYAKQVNQNPINVNGLAKFINPSFDAGTIAGTLYKLMQDGLVTYDEGNQLLYLRDALPQFVLNAAGRGDYDELKIPTLNDSLVARILLDSSNMQLYGIKNIMLSDSSFVVIFPKADSLFIHKNRDMNFSGYLFAGRLDVYGKKLYFKYDENKIDLVNTDSATFNIPTGKTNKYGEPELVPIGSSFKVVKGHIQINAADNKSGISSSPWAPMLVSELPSLIFYNKPKKSADTLYKPAAFYFEVDPFKFDSLNDYDQSQLKFQGKLVSAGIFPDIPELVVLQTDLSLGFQTTVSQMPVYKGKGIFSDTISLSNAGLRGAGILQFLSTTLMNSFIQFYPDSLFAKAKSVDMKNEVIQNTKFPFLHGTDDLVKWRPYHDTMIVQMKNQPFEVYDSTTLLRGNILITAKGVIANGLIDFAHAKVQSKNMLITADQLHADTSDVFIKSEDTSHFAISFKNAKSSLDFANHRGDFVTNQAVPPNLTVNRYKVSVNKLSWLMDKNEFHFASDNGTPVSLTSTTLAHDSLKIFPRSADYNLQYHSLHADGVQSIRVADALIYPDSQKIAINPDGKIDSLLNAKIISDTLNKYHTFYNALVTILNKTNYKAQAEYDYISHSGKRETINLSDIHVVENKDKELHTFATGTIDSNDHFELISKFFYKGKASIAEPDAAMLFKGFAHSDMNNQWLQPEWFSIADTITKDSLMLPFARIVSDSGKLLQNGICLSQDSIPDLKTLFFMPQPHPSDRMIFKIAGATYYDDVSKQYIVGDKKLLQKATDIGNVLRINSTTGKITADGKTDFGLNFGMIGLQGAGAIQGDLNSNVYSFTNFSIGIGFTIDKSLLDLMAHDISNYNGDADAVDVSTQLFQHNISQLIVQSKKSAAVNLSDPMQSDGLPFGILLSNVNLVWDKDAREFYSKGPIGVVFVGANGVQRNIKGVYLNFGYRNSGDFMNIYIPCGDDSWYYLYYAKNVLQIISGNPNFNTMLGKISSDKRTVKSVNGFESYEYDLGIENRKNTFIHEMKSLQAGIK